MTQSTLEKANVGRSAAIMSVGTILSRITGFVRTWALAFALGNTFITSSYQIANNLPNMLYELVAGGIIVTAFLPVYLDVKRKLGKEGANKYASNLTTLVSILAVTVSILGIIFADKIVYIQMFMSDAGDQQLAIHFFRYFSIQVLLYSLSSLISGLLNAHRDYLWAAIAPIFNNLVTIATIFSYIPISKYNPDLAINILAIGTSLGVLAQVVIQVPALKKHEIKLKPHINLKDPALVDTWRIGAPAVIVMVLTFAMVSVRTASLMGVSEVGQSIHSYAYLWYTLPYSFLAVPITTAMFTELSDWYSNGDIVSFKKGISEGIRQQLFFMIPISFMLAVFAKPLVTLYHSGAFTSSDVEQVAVYLLALSPSLPFFALQAYFNKIFSSMRQMKVYAFIDFITVAVQVILFILLTRGFLGWEGFGIIGVPIAVFVQAVLLAVISFAVLRHKLGLIGLKSIIKTSLIAVAFGVAGALVGYAVLYGLSFMFGDISGSILRSFAYIVPSGILALVVTYGGAYVAKIPESQFLSVLFKRIAKR